MDFKILNVGVQSLEIDQEKEKHLDKDIFSIRPRYFKCGPVRTSEELGSTQTYEGSEQSVGYWLIKCSFRRRSSRYPTMVMP